MKNNFKTLDIIDGKEYIFNSKAFKREFRRVAATTKKCDPTVTLSAFREAFADKVHTSASAISQWEAGNNGVSDLKRVKELALNLGITDYKLLLIERETTTNKGEITMVSVEERMAAKAVFEIITDLIILFKDTVGFSQYTQDFRDETKVDRLDLETAAERVVKRSRFELPLDVYNGVDELLSEINYACLIQDEVETERELYLEVDRMTDQFFAKLHEVMKPYLKD